MNEAEDVPSLRQEIENLRERLAEAESVLNAIRTGEIDAVVVNGPAGGKVYTLEGADHPYRVLVETMNEGAATLTADGVVLYANRRLAGLLGTQSTDLIDALLSRWLPPDDAARLEQMLHRSAEESVSGELTLLAKNGTLPVQISLSPLELQGARLRCAIVTDVSLAKNQEALEAAAQRVREANERLREEDRRKDEFLATLAHELRNPLAPIRAAAHVIKVLSPSDVRIVKAQDMIERQVTHLARLVDDLMELSRITLGRITLQRRTESLASLLAGVADATQPAIEANAHELALQLPDEPLLIDVDSVRVSQAVSNVLENAVKYTPPGGRIAVRACREGREAVIRIEDSGIGIAREMLARIFDMFVQVDHSGRRSGLGIGLALTRRLIEMHGGTITVASAGPGHGTEFTIRLPLAVDGSADEVPARPDVQPAVKPQRVLVVDDNVDAAESLRIVLELAGHEVRTEHRGAAALQAVDSFQPDVVLLDIGLPDLDGYEVARRIRARHGSAHPTVVALSGWGQAEDKHRAAAAGIDAHYTKPIDPFALTLLFTERGRGTAARVASGADSP